MTEITARMDFAALRHVDVAFVENQWMLDLLRERMGSERVVFAPPGVDTRIFRPKETDQLADERFLLSVGRFADARKNVLLLFEA